VKDSNNQKPALWLIRSILESVLPAFSFFRLPRLPRPIHVCISIPVFRRNPATILFIMSWRPQSTGRRVELMEHMRRSRHASPSGQSRGQIVDAISIRERPAEVEDRAIPGHWEGDLFAGGKNSYVATLVERHSRFLMLIKVPSKNTAVVVAALSKHVRKLPATLRRTLTWDRGLEMAKHKEFTVPTKVQVHFCDPQKPLAAWHERKYQSAAPPVFPRGTDLSPLSQAQLDQVSLRLNQRPRKTLGFETPASKLQASVASTI
jgi:IS30 family transposase